MRPSFLYLSQFVSKISDRELYAYRRGMDPSLGPYPCQLCSHVSLAVANPIHRKNTICNVNNVPVHLNLLLPDAQPVQHTHYFASSRTARCFFFFFLRRLFICFFVYLFVSSGMFFSLHDGETLVVFFETSSTIHVCPLVP